MRSGTKEQDQDQNAVVMANDMEKVEEDARQAENKVQKTRMIYSTKLRNYLFRDKNTVFTDENET